MNEISMFFAIILIMAIIIGILEYQKCCILEIDIMKRIRNLESLMPNVGINDNLVGNKYTPYSGVSTSVIDIDKNNKLTLLVLHDDSKRFEAGIILHDIESHCFTKVK